jgi:hypothetical protein
MLAGIGFRAVHQGYEGFHKALGITFRNLTIFAILIYRFSPILFYSPLINVREDLMSKGNVSMHVDSLTNIFNLNLHNCHFKICSSLSPY